MVRPRGTYTWWRWPAAAAGASSLAWDLTVLRDPGPTSYFWAHSWCFQGGDVGYFGLQAHDRRDDGSQGRLAVFSVWSAIGCGDNPGCHAGVEGSPFWTCRLAYQWQPGRVYRLRVDQLSAGWWRASVADLAEGAETTVGSIRVPSSWGGLDLAARRSAMWVEFYAANAPGGVAAGELVPHTRVRFGTPAAGTRGAAATAGVHGPAAGGGMVAPAGHANRLGEGEGDNSSVGDDGDGVLHEMGIPPPASSDPR